MATIENNGLMVYLDSTGNENILYPITKAELVEGLAAALDAKANGYVRTLTADDDVNDLKDDGVYVYPTSVVTPDKDGKYLKNAPFENAAVIMVFGAKSTTTQKIQMAFRYGEPGYFKYRPLLGGTGWMAWKQFATTESVEESIAIVEADLKKHADDKNNPHGVTAAQVGLGNVPNVTTNNQTPTYSQASSLANLTSGEKLSVSFGKIMKAIADLISHIGNKSNPHAVTADQSGARPNTWLPTIAEIGGAKAGYGYGEPAILLQSQRVNTEAELEDLLYTIYNAMNSKDTKMVYWAGFPAGDTGHGWFGILTRSSGSNGSLIAWSAYDYGRLIRKVRFSDKWQAVEYYATTTEVEQKTEMNVLWTNAKTTSSFEAQTISIDLSAYDWVEIISFYNINGSRRLAPFMCNVGASHGGFMIGFNPSDKKMVGRTVTSVTTAGVSFADAYNDGVSDNSVCIPYKIIGYKGV